MQATNTRLMQRRFMPASTGMKRLQAKERQ
jgi:hypothetical protein